jgi:LETM1 and EF-hand domain-containing protein 1
MKSLGLTQFRLKHQLQEWLQLSTQKKIPISLLIMSRAFSLTESDEPEDILRSSMSSLDSDTINEVVVAAASAGEEKTVDMQKRKLESLRFQEEVRRCVLCCGVFLSDLVFDRLLSSVSFSS